MQPLSNSAQPVRGREFQRKRFGIYTRRVSVAVY